MNLHLDKKTFTDICNIVGRWKGLNQSDIKRDYYIVLMLNNLSMGSYGELCVFKGGTSLSKGYPGLIERFSEDIDLSYIPNPQYSDKEYERILKQIEKEMTLGANLVPISEERNKRNKSSYVYWEDETSRIKLEIGSSVKPEPYNLKAIKTYIQEYLEFENLSDIVEKYNLKEIFVNILCVERTFIDKLMAIKRHAKCGSLELKVRHIYDVYRLSQAESIKDLLMQKEELVRIMKLTKNTDSIYLEKRMGLNLYNSLEAYNFPSWENIFDTIEVRKAYENLHLELLYTDEKQDFNKALECMRILSQVFDEVGE